MLLLDRTLGESIIIVTPDGDEIKITVTAAHNRSLQLGFDADRKFTIVREEIYDGR